MRRAAAFVGVTLAVLLLAEAAVRVVTYTRDDVIRWRPEIFYVDAKPRLSPGPFGDLVPGRAVWMFTPERAYTVSVNAEGLRGREPVDWQARRILAVGDSFTFGPYVEDDETWPAVLETMLRARGERVQVLNAGVSGYGIAQEAAYLTEKGLRLRPALVLLAITGNDVETDLGAARRGLFARPAPESAWRSVLRHSAFATLANRLGVERQRRAAVEEHVERSVQIAPDYDEYAARFDALVAALRAAHVPLVVVLTTRRQEPRALRAFLHDLARRHDVPVIDTEPAIRRHPVDDVYLRDNGHHSAFGYRVVAQGVAAALH